MADTTGGDGSPAPITGQEHTNLPEIQGDVSSTPEELEAKINAELGLPSTPPAPKTEDKADGEQDSGTDNSGASGDADANTEGDADAEGDESGTEEDSDEGGAGVDDTAVAATPSDEELFIEVEDAEGVTHKISKIEDLPEDFQPRSNRQGLEILDQLRDLRDDIKERDTTRAAAEATAAEAQAQKEQFSAWDREIVNLGTEKRLDVKDEDLQTKVFEHMRDINAARIKAGNPNLITSFEDAFEKYEAQVAKDAASDKTKQENERAKIKASLIGGNSSASTGDAQPYRSGQYRSMDEVPI